MAERGSHHTAKEIGGTGLEIGGIIGAVIGLAELNPAGVIVGGVIFYGGKKLKEHGKQGK